MVEDFGTYFQSVGGIGPIGGEGQCVPMKEFEVVNLERRYKMSLPALYRQMLLTYGACSPSEIVSFDPPHRLPKEVSTDGGGLLNVFYGGQMDNGEDAYSLALRIKSYRKLIPKHVIPIADDGGGDQICLGVVGDHYGKVFYFEAGDFGKVFYLELDGSPDSSKLHLIADSLEDLLSTLKRVEC